MNHSEQLNELAAALSKAQGQIEGAKKDAKNLFFKSSYSTLASVWDACRKPLSDNGLSVTQCPEEADNGIAIETMLLHSSGQWIKSRYTMPVSKLDAQAVGSAITYARRYALSAVVGIAPEDDDGNAAAAAKTAKPKTEQKEKSLPVLSDDEFEKKSLVWNKSMKDKGETAENLIAFLQTKYTFAEDQLLTIKSWGNENADA